MKTVQISIISSNLTLFSGGGGGTQFYGQNDFMDIWAFLIFGEKREGNGKKTKRHDNFRQLRAVGPNLSHTAQSGVAGPCGARAPRIGPADFANTPLGLPGSPGELE